ncbi:MAG: transglutaminase domain-containing protein [Actinomycetota bacterium]
MESPGPTVNRTAALRALALVLAWVGCVLATTPWWALFPTDRIAPISIAACAIPLVLPAVAVQFRRSATASGTATLLAFVAYALGAVLRSPLAFDELARGFTRSPAQLLSATPPFTEPRALMIVPIACSWMSAAIVGEAVARSARNGVVVATWLAAFVGAYAMTADESQHAVGPAFALAAVASAFVLTRHLVATTRTRDEGLLRLALSRAVIGVGAFGLAAGVALVVPDSSAAESPASLRRAPAVHVAEPISPLRELATMRDEADPETPAELFVVTTDGDTAGYVALAELGSYDGDTWRFSRRFEPTGGHIPGADTTGVPSQRQHYEITDLRDLRWMPYMVRPEAVEGISVQHDPASGMPFPARPLTSDDGYVVVSRAPVQSLAVLDPADAALTPGPARSIDDTLLPLDGRQVLTEVVAQFEDDLGIAARREPGRFLYALLVEFRGARRMDMADGPLDAGAERADGMSLSEVVAAVVGRREATPEQFATLFTLVAREIGVPARLVTGFRVGGESGHTLAAGRYRVTDADAWAWASVRLRDGWVVADPTPGAGTTAVTTTTAPPTGGPSTTLPAEVGVEADESTTSVAIAPRVPPDPPAPPVDWLRTVAIAVAVVVLGAPLLYQLRRAARRWQRRNGGPQERVVGAWQEVLDALAIETSAPIAAATAPEVVARLRTRCGDRAAEPARSLANLANVAIFNTQREVTEDEAARAWHAQRMLASSLRRARSLSDHLRALVRFRGASPGVGAEV